MHRGNPLGHYMNEVFSPKADGAKDPVDQLALYPPSVRYRSMTTDRSADFLWFTRYVLPAAFSASKNTWTPLPISGSSNSLVGFVSQIVKSSSPLRASEIIFNVGRSGLLNLPLAEIT